MLAYSKLASGQFSVIVSFRFGRNLLLNNQRFLLRNVGPLANDSDSSASCSSRRLHDEDGLDGRVLLLVPFGFRSVVIFRQYESVGHEVELAARAAERALHAVQVAPQTVLSSDLERAWKVVEFLVASQRFEAFCSHVSSEAA